MRSAGICEITQQFRVFDDTRIVQISISEDQPTFYAIRKEQKYAWTWMILLFVSVMHIVHISVKHDLCQRRAISVVGEDSMLLHKTLDQNVAWAIWTQPHLHELCRMLVWSDRLAWCILLFLSNKIASFHGRDRLLKVCEYVSLIWSRSLGWYFNHLFKIESDWVKSVYLNKASSTKLINRGLGQDWIDNWNLLNVISCSCVWICDLIYVI